MKAGSDAESSGDDDNEEEKENKNGSSDEESEKDADVVTLQQDENEVGLGSIVGHPALEYFQANYEFLYFSMTTAWSD